MPYALYIASAAGAIALLLMMPRVGYTPWKFGALLGAATLGGLWLLLARLLPDDLGLEAGAFPYYYVFSFIAIASAARVITHTKPVYAALWFIMVIIASAGLFLVLAAEFMAFAMLIIYGGAILVTYMFVIMLASQTGDTSEVKTTAEQEDDDDAIAPLPAYDRVAREPLAACAVGFLLLAVILQVAFAPLQRNRDTQAPSDAAVIANVLPDRAAQRLADRIGPELVPDAATLSNAERVGLDLFQKHPLGIELAGLILLVSLVGAVVIARTKVQAQEQA
jgi:NADH-quinone oxidoreductase subunit J